MSVDALFEPQTMAALLAAVAVFATIMALVAPLFEGNDMAKRAERVVAYKDQLRTKARAELRQRPSTPNLRGNKAPEGMVKRLVDQFRLLEVFDADAAKRDLIKAGMRGERPVIMFMFARVATPVVMLLLAIFYMYGLKAFDFEPFMRLVVTGGVTAIGFFLPKVWLTNKITKRQQTIQLDFPDALDLLLICVESGMSIELALQKVTDEIAPESPELAEELGLTLAELSYLQDRRTGFTNLGDRTGLESVKAVAMALNQAEAYGTPLGQALRVMAAELREQRMQTAEKKAAALPPKLTVPMIVFFLPVLFIIILGPGAIIALSQ